MTAPAEAPPVPRGRRRDDANNAGCPVELERPARHAWVCPHCHRPSRDIRRVCAHCLGIEPGAVTSTAGADCIIDYIAATTTNKNNNNNNISDNNNTTALTGGDATTQTKEANASVIIPVSTMDSHVSHFTMPHTGRVYRRYTEPIRRPTRLAVSDRAAEEQFQHTRRASDAEDDMYADEDTDVEEESMESNRDVRDELANELRSNNGLDKSAQQEETKPTLANARTAVDNESVTGNTAGPRAAAAAAAAAPMRVLTIHDVVRAAGHSGEGSGCSNQGNAMPTAFSVAPTAHRHVSQPSHPTRQHVPFTHFVSLPIGKFSSVQAAAEALRVRMTDVVAQQQRTAAEGAANTMSHGPSHRASRGQQLTRSHLIPHTAQMHITLLLLTLSSEPEVELAKTLLHSSFPALWAAAQASLPPSAERCYVRLSHLRVMGDSKDTPSRNTDPRQPCHPNNNANASAARVVYMDAADDSTREVLGRLTGAVQTALRELITDLAEAERTRNKPHMTLVNAKWAEKHKRHGRGGVDVRPLLQALGEASLGGGADGKESFAPEWIELCRRGPKDSHTHGYVVETKVSLLPSESQERERK